MVSAISNDRTWPLVVLVDATDDSDPLPVMIRVRGDYTIGEVMAIISEQMGPRTDWSDYALWWPEQRKWIKQCRLTLDQADICANRKLLFTPMHKTLRIQLPTLSIVEMKVDFSVNVLTAVADLCNELCIRHSEELSLARPLTSSHLKRNNPNIEASPLQRQVSTATLEKNSKSLSKINVYSNGTFNGKSNGNHANTSFGTISSNQSLNGSNYSLSSPEFKDVLLRPKSAVEKARLNSAWLNSSISLHEQDVCAHDLLLLRFKFYSFYDLNPKIDITRIYYLYEQLKWSILTEEISCTEDEMYTLAGISLQATLSSGGQTFSRKATNGHSESGHLMHSPKLNGNGYRSQASLSGIESNGGNHNSNGHHIDNGIHNTSANEIDSALEDLEKTLQGTSLNGMHGKHLIEQNNVLVVPELVAKLKISYQKIKSSSTLNRFKFMNSEKPYYVVFRDTTLTAYKSADYDSRENRPKTNATAHFTLNINLCEVNPDVLVSQQKYCFQIIESQPSGAIEYYVKCQDEAQYAQWYTACKQASLGRTMAHASYNDQFKNTLKLLQIQSKSSRQVNQYNKKDLANLNIQPEEFIAPRFMKRKSKEQIIRKIKTVHENFINDSPIDAQMNFIRTCQSLRDFGITLFVVRLVKPKREDILGIAQDKLLLIDINSGSVKKTWRYKTMINWNINWEVKKMSINFKDDSIEFECLSADCKVIHEFIGGYIYMSMRTSSGAHLDEEQFLRLTGGWNELQDDTDD